MKRTRELGRLDAGKETLAEFGAGMVARCYAAAQPCPLHPAGLRDSLDRHVLPRLGGMRVRDLSPRVLSDASARTSRTTASVRRPFAKSLVIPARVLARAVEWERIAVQPGVRGAQPVGQAQPGRHAARARGDRDHAQVAGRRGRLGDATLVSVLAYAGLRPGEALALTWDHVGERTLLVEGAVSLGELKETKTGRSRSVPWPAPLRQDLAEWRLAAGRPASDRSSSPARAASRGRRSAWKNWRRRIFAPAAEARRRHPPRARTTCATRFVSLLIHDGRSVVEVARQAGHAPTMTLSTYAHVFDEFTPDDRIPIEDQIRRARGEHVPVSYLPGQVSDRFDAENPVSIEWSQGGSNP